MRGISQAMRRESSQVFQPEWHPEDCQCGECGTRLRQEEQRVLGQFEDEMNRLEDDVRRNARFSSTSRRYIDAECLPDYTRELLKGFPARETEVAEDAGLPARNPRTTTACGGDGEGPERHSSVRKRYIMYDFAENDARSDEGRRKEAAVGAGADDQHLHNGYGPLVEADDPGWGTVHHHHRHNYHRSSPSRARQTQGWECQESVEAQREVQHGLGRQQSLESRVDQRYSANNEALYKKAVKVKGKRSLTLRIKDTIKRRYQVASRAVRYHTRVL